MPRSEQAQGDRQHSDSDVPAHGVEVEWLGRVPYVEALELQRRRVAERRAGAAGDRLLLLEHPPVVTLGRGTQLENLLEPREALQARGVEVHEVARGGDVTWHGPGQLVGYLILDLEARGEPDVHAHLRRIESLLIESLDRAGVPAGRREGMTGVFVDPPDPARPARKLASIGVGLRGWTTYHGFALNVATGPESFAGIRPCGLHGVTMTSVREERPGGLPAAELMTQMREFVTESALSQLASSSTTG